MPVPRSAMTAVPGGTMELRDARLGTSRTVELQPFSISGVPVTWELYRNVLDVPVSVDQADEAPVHSISWLGAVSWCNALSAGSGLSPAYGIDGDEVLWDVTADGYRLPTEAEWEWACRARTTGPRYGPLLDIAWSANDEVPGPQEVASKQPNAFGLFDMLGNVWEWCWDYYDPARYADYRVLRGGGWADKHWSVRASVRRGSMPSAEFDDLGFRIVRGAIEGAEAAQGWSHRADQERARLTKVPPGSTRLRI